jgi:hypothetical protein
MFCFTACPSTTPTVATPSLWQLIYNVTGTYGRLAMFGLKVDGSETGPTVAWSGLTTGAAGTPAITQIINMGNGFGEIAGVLQTDVLGAVSDLVGATTSMTGGTGVTTTTDSCILFAYGVRVTPWSTVAETQGWDPMNPLATVSGADMAMMTSWGIKSPAGSLANHVWTLTGSSSSNGSGIIVALQPTLPLAGEAGVIAYTRGIAN